MVTEDPVDGLRGVVINTASVAAFDGQLKDNTAPPPINRTPQTDPTAKACFEGLVVYGEAVLTAWSTPSVSSPARALLSDVC